MSHPSNPASHPFPPLAPQDPMAMQDTGTRRRFLPQISLPWLEIGLALMLIAVWHLG